VLAGDRRGRRRIEKRRLPKRRRRPRGSESLASLTLWASQRNPRVILYDNLKSAVLERRGAVVRFHPTLLALATHYRFQPRPVAVARGNDL
jgi:hypothetical protein